MNLTPYLFFNGRCEEALDFYKSALGATADALIRFGEAPDRGKPSPEKEEKVMHAAVRVGDAQVFASDGYCTGQTDFQGFALALTAKTEEDTERVRSLGRRRSGAGSHGRDLLRLPLWHAHR